MNLPTDQHLLQLVANRPLPLKQARGVRVHCVEGVVWMTVAGVPGDIILRAGQSFRIPCNGLALIEAMPEAQIRLEAAAPVLLRWPVLWRPADATWRGRLRQFANAILLGRMLRPSNAA